MKPYITKDGVTVAKSLKQLGSDPLGRLGAKLIIDAAERTNEVCGDGTTTSTIIASEILKEGLKHLRMTQLNPIEMRKGIQAAVQTVLKTLDKMAIPISSRQDIFNVAYISSNGDRQLADLITEVYLKVGIEGTISIQEGRGQQKTEVQYMEGYSLESGFLSPYFVERQERKAD